MHSKGFPVNRFFRAALALMLFTGLFSSRLQGQTAFPAPTEMHEQIGKLDASGEAKLAKGDFQGAHADFQKAFEFSREMTRLYKDDAEYEPVYREQSYLFLERLATMFATSGEDAKALKMMEPATAGYEELAAVKKTPESRNFAAVMLGRLAWLQLKNNQPVEAEKSSLRGIALDPSVAWIKTNQAHALLLNGKTSEAMKLYAAEQNTPLGDGRTFGQAALDDFTDLEKSGITHPGFTEVRQLYGAPAVAPKPATQKEKKGFPWGFVSLIIAFFGLVFGALLYFEKKRIQKLEAAANRLGYNFRAKPTDADVSVINGTHMATLGQRRTVSNVIKPPPAERTLLFEFQFTIGSGKSSRTMTQTVIRLVSDKLAAVPAFVLRPESLMDKVAAAFGQKDIDFPEHPTFSKKYLLRGQDEAAIRNFFTPGIVAFFEQERGWNVEVQGDQLFAYRENHRAGAEEITSFMDSRRRILGLLVSGRV